MPAFVWILDDRDFLFLVEMDDIKRAVLIARLAPFAFLQIYDRRHIFSSLLGNESVTPLYPPLS